MAVYQHRWLSRGVQSLGVNNRMAGRRHDLNLLHTDPAQLVRDPLGRPLYIRLVLGQRGNTGDGDEFLQLAQETIRLPAREID